MEEYEPKNNSDDFLSNDKSKEDLIFVCPKCFKGIPLLSFGIIENKLDISIQCICFSQNQNYLIDNYLDQIENNQLSTGKCKKHNRESKHYCVNCFEWLCEICLVNHKAELRSSKNHSLSRYELQNRCLQHNNNYSKYCHSCKINICSNCNNHNSHKTTVLISIEINEINTIIQEVIQSSPILFREIFKLRNYIANTYRLSHNYPSYFLMNIIDAVKMLKQQNLKSKIEDPKKLKGHTGKVIGILQLQTGEVVSYSSDSTIIIWNIQNYQPISVLKEHTKFVSKVIELDKKRLASSSGDLTIKIWSSTTYKCLGTLQKHQNIIHEICYLNNNKLASKSLEGTILIWDISSCKCIKEIDNKSDRITSSLMLYVKRTNELISCLSMECKFLNIWNLDNLKCNEITSKNNISKLSELNNGNVLIMTEKTIDILNCRNKTKRNVENAAKINYVIELSSSQLAMISQENTIVFYNLKTFKLDSVLSLPKKNNYMIRVFQMSNGQLIAFTRTVIYVINPITYKTTTIFADFKKYITTVFEIFKEQVACCSWDYSMKIWSTTTYDLIVTLPVNINWIPMAISTGQIAIVSTEESVIELW